MVKSLRISAPRMWNAPYAWSAAPVGKDPECDAKRLAPPPPETMTEAIERKRSQSMSSHRKLRGQHNPRGLTDDIPITDETKCPCCTAPRNRRCRFTAQLGQRQSRCIRF